MNLLLLEGLPPHLRAGQWSESGRAGAELFSKNISDQKQKQIIDSIEDQKLT
jgi:hypothetical protein